MNTQTDSLASAIARMGAVEVAPGRYAAHQEGDGWYTFEPYLFNDSEADFVRAERLGCRNVAWMPDWWSPERRRHVNCDHDLDCVYRYCADRIWNSERMDLEREREFVEGWRGHAERFNALIITADLTTGEEVSA